MNKLARIVLAVIGGSQLVIWAGLAIWWSLKPPAAVGPWQSQETVPTTGTAKIIIVEMNDALRFVPAAITVKAGDTVEWRNVGRIPHTITADPKRLPGSKDIALPAGAQAFDSGWVLSGQRFRYTFSAPGVYRFICLAHARGRMLGTLTVG